MVDIIDNAIELATKHHAGQLRKYNTLPYFVHLEEVATLYSLFNLEDFEDEAIAACYLHDTLEDTKCTKDEIIEACGTLTLSMVLALTDVTDPTKNRATRKLERLEALSEQGACVQTIKVCDLISNATSIIRYDPKFSPVFVQEMKDLVNALTRAPSSLRTIAYQIIMGAEESWK